MDWTVPGTVLRLPRENADNIQEQFSSMFLAGGLSLSQVSAVTGLETHPIQNWVKRGFLPPPENRRYSQKQLCRIIQINMLKSALSLETICSLLEYINGKLVEKDLPSDTEIYECFDKYKIDKEDIFGKDVNNYDIEIQGDSSKTE